MSLQLDARQRAMLEEMGVRVFAPVAAAAADDASALAEAGLTEATEARAPVARGGADLPPAQPPRPAARPEPAAAGRVVGAVPAAEPRVPTLEGGLDVSGLDWDGLVAAATALAGGRRMVFGSGEARADWMLVGEPLTEEEEREDAPFAGAPGKLLDNMLAALGLNRRQGVYLTNAVKARPGSAGLQPAELAAWSAVLCRQVALVQPRVILAMGRFPMQLLLEGNEPLGRMRGRTHACGGVPVVVTYAPGYLLRAMPDKARAWADLCLARTLVG